MIVVNESYVKENIFVFLGDMVVIILLVSGG